MTNRTDEAAEHLYRLSEFRKWVESNVLFPTVPDVIVHPLRQHLLEAEHRLVNFLYDRGEFERVAQVHKALLTTP
jgi:hypothetical protein